MLKGTVIASIAALAITAFVSIHGFVCTPDFCSMVRCDTTVRDKCLEKGQDFREKGGTCGCCDLCLDFLEVGDCCKPDDHPHIRGIQTQERRCRTYSHWVNGTCKHKAKCNGIVCRPTEACY